MFDLVKIPGIYVLTKLNRAAFIVKCQPVIAVHFVDHLLFGLKSKIVKALTGQRMLGHFGLFQESEIRDQGKVECLSFLKGKPQGDEKEVLAIDEHSFRQEGLIYEPIGTDKGCGSEKERNNDRCGGGGKVQRRADGEDAGDKEHEEIKEKQGFIPRIKGF